MSLHTLGIITDATMREHKATWFVYAGSQKIRRTSTMRGFWGYDVECSCGVKSNTGGGTERYLKEWLEDHRYDAQTTTKAGN